MASHVLTTGSAPTTTPDDKGQMHIDNVANLAYVAFGTGSSADWKVDLGGGGLSGNIRNDRGTNPGAFTVTMDDPEPIITLTHSSSTFVITFAAPTDTAKAFSKKVIYLASGTPTAPTLAYTGGTNRFTKNTVSNVDQHITVYWIGNGDYFTVIERA